MFSFPFFFLNSITNRVSACVYVYVYESVIVDAPVDIRRKKKKTRELSYFIVSSNVMRSLKSGTFFNIFFLFLLIFVDYDIHVRCFYFSTLRDTIFLFFIVFYGRQTKSFYRSCILATRSGGCSNLFSNIRTSLSLIFHLPSRSFSSSPRDSFFSFFTLDCFIRRQTKRYSVDKLTMLVDSLRN